MLLRLFLLFTLVPLADLLLLLMISKAIPVWASVTLIVGSGFLGAWLARHQWATVKSRIQSRLSMNEAPGELMTDGMMVVLAGGLLIAPGLITDALGMSLLIPACRRWYKKRATEYLKEYFKVRVVERMVPKDFFDHDIVDGEAVDTQGGKETPYSDGSQFEAPLPTIEGTIHSPDSSDK